MNIVIYWRIAPLNQTEAGVSHGVHKLFASQLVGEVSIDGCLPRYNDFTVQHAPHIAIA